MSKILIFLIKKYQSIPGRWHSYCKFQPTCSQYAIGVLKEFGFVKGIFLILKRIIRCNPFGSGGYDPIPVRGGKNGKN